MKSQEAVTPQADVQGGGFITYTLTFKDAQEKGLVTQQVLPEKALGTITFTVRRDWEANGRYEGTKPISRARQVYS